MIREWLIDAALTLNRFAHDGSPYSDQVCEAQEGLFAQFTPDETVAYLARKGHHVPASFQLAMSRNMGNHRPAVA